MRTKELFNEQWHFCTGDLPVKFPTYKGATYASAKTEHYLMGPASVNYDSTPDRYDAPFLSERWEYVRLPHDYVVLQEPDPAENNALGYLKYENAWYRKIFTVPEEDCGKRITLEFEGIATHAEVYLNGTIMKRSFCGYTSFEVDVSDVLRYGESNVLSVYVSTQEHEGWWYEGGGIYRNVWLIKTDEIAVDRYGVYAIPRKISDEEWTVDFETTLVSVARAPETAEVRTELIDADGRVVASAGGTVTVGSHDRATARYSARIADPVLWDLDHPYLYTVRTTVSRNGAVCDEDFTRTGFRYFRCDPEKGFFLNGKHVKIKGVCGHEDCGLFGKAVPANIHRYKAEMMKEMGANAYRTSHYQQNAALLDAMDELGFIVFDEARWFSPSEEAVSQLEELIRRDRNRPSVFFWSLSNEEPCHVTGVGKRITKTLMEAVKRLDDTRVITGAVCHAPEKAAVFDELDVIGINYNLALFDEVHKNHPEKAILSSENCATGTTRGWYSETCGQRGYASAYDHDTNDWFLGRERTWKFIMERDYIMGGYQWDAFEHRGETVWPRLCSMSGAIDLYLQRKDAFYQNQSHWCEQPVIHMLPHWNVKTFDGEPVKVWVYTNCGEAELILNGRSLGRRTAEKYTHLEWEVPFEEGRIEAVGYVGGAECVRDVRETASAPVRLALKAENAISGPEDAAIVTCTVVDGQGRPVPDASPVVEFHTNAAGQVIATGSDNTDHNPLPSLSRRMYAGSVTVAVGAALERGRAVARTGVIELYARADGLEPARIRIPF